MENTLHFPGSCKLMLPYHTLGSTLKKILLKALSCSIDVPVSLKFLASGPSALMSVTLLDIKKNLFIPSGSQGPNSVIQDWWHHIWEIHLYPSHIWLSYPFPPPTRQSARPSRFAVVHCPLPWKQCYVCDTTIEVTIHIHNSQRWQNVNYPGHA